MLAEAATQDDRSAVAVEEGDVAAGGSTGRIGKQLAVETEVDGTLLRLPLLYGWTHMSKRSCGGSHKIRGV